VRSRSSPTGAPGWCASPAPPRLPRPARGYARTSTTPSSGAAPGRRSQAASRGTRRSNGCCRDNAVKVAYYSPLPPERSGIADYSVLLLPALERLVDVEVVRRGRTRPVAADVALYHVGNDPEAHGWIVDALRRRRGVVVLHDFVLHHLVAGLTLGRKDGPAYLAAMERDAGILGRLVAHGVLEGRVAPIWETRPDEFPLVGQILEA